MREVYWAVRRPLLIILVLFAVVAALLFVPLPISSTYFARTIENAGHTPLFFMLTMGLLLVLRSQPRLAGLRLYLVAGIIGAAAGLLSEAIQRPLARDASWEDVAADLVGVIGALALYAMFEGRSKLRRWHRGAALLVLLVCTAIFLAPLARMTRAYLHRNGQFPVLADFSSPLELYWTVNIGVRREIVDDSLAVEFGDAHFPGIAFHEPVPDWRRFKTLVVDVENPDTEPLLLTVRVHDRRHNRSFHDRFNRSFDLAPAERRTLHIPLEDIRRAPRGRLMDMAHISDVTLFRGSHTGSRKLRIHGLRLQ